MAIDPFQLMPLFVHSVVVWCHAPPEESPGFLNLLPSTSQYNVSEIFPENYDKYLLPPTTDGRPIRIYFTFVLSNVLNVDETRGLIRYQTHLSFAWREPRLVVPEWARNYSSMTLDTNLQDRLWVPDIFIDDQEDYQQGRLMRNIGHLDLLTNGYVHYGVYASFSVGCDMDFSAYPFDTHQCLVGFGSYIHMEDRIEMAWTPQDEQLFIKDKTVKFHTLSISFKRTGPESDCYDGYQDQKFCYSVTSVDVRLQRSTTFFFCHTFLPCILLVATSWLSLLLPPDVIPGRMVLCITSLLALLTMFTSSLGSMRVSYMRASDVWFGVCLLFDFLIILEYAVLLWLQREREERGTQWTKVQPFQPTKESNGVEKTAEPSVGWWQRFQNPSYMDCFSRWLLAVLFTVFCITFLVYNLTKGD